MKKSFVLTVAAAAALLALAVPAQAKGPGDEMTVSTSATVSGPGIKGPVSISDRTFTNKPEGFVLADQLLLYDGAVFATRPEGSLGPRYAMTVGMSCAGIGREPESAVIHLDLYPFARFGPWLYSRSIQIGCFGQSVGQGWKAVSPGTIDLFRSAGLPATPPVVANSARSASSLAPSATRPWLIVGLASALTLLVVAGALAGWKRSRTQVPLAG